MINIQHNGLFKLLTYLNYRTNLITIPKTKYINVENKIPFEHLNLSFIANKYNDPKLMKTTAGKILKNTSFLKKTMKKKSKDISE